MSEHRISVSIGLPVFNGETFIAEALDSLLRQTFSDFELLISDNASTDRTAEIIQECASRDPRIRYCRNAANLGIIENCNRVARAAAGEFFMFAACDDTWEATFVETLVGILQADPRLGLVHCGYDWIDASGQVTRRGKTQWLVGEHSNLRAVFSFGVRNPWYQNFLLYYLWRNPFPSYGLFRRLRLQAALPLEYHDGSAANADNLFMLRFLLQRNRVDHTPEVLFHYRDRPRASGDYSPPDSSRTPAGVTPAEPEESLRSRVRTMIKAESLPLLPAYGLELALPALSGARHVLSRLDQLRRLAPF